MKVIIFTLSAKKKSEKVQRRSAPGTTDHPLKPPGAEGWRRPGTLQQVSRFPEQTPKGFLGNLGALLPQGQWHSLDASAEARLFK